MTLCGHIPSHCMTQWLPLPRLPAHSPPCVTAQFWVTSYNVREVTGNSIIQPATPLTCPSTDTLQTSPVIKINIHQITRLPITVLRVMRDCVHWRHVTHCLVGATALSCSVKASAASCCNGSEELALHFVMLTLSTLSISTILRGGVVLIISTF